MAFLDSTAVNVALPAIGTELDSSLSGLQWTVTGYTLSLASLILLGGALGDRYGRRRVFVVGVVWFAVASLVCGLAQSTGQLVAARVLQGIGGALLTPGSLSLIQASFRVQDRARAIGLWSALAGVTSLGGPFVGGFLIDSVSWRLVFLVNVPLAAAVVWVSARHVPESRDPAHHGRFDVLGAVLAALALGGTTYALITAGDGTGTAVWGTAAVGVGAAVGFVLRERRAADPMLPLGVFTDRQFSGANLSTLAVYGALGGFSFFLVLQLQTVLGYDATAAGAATVPGIAVISLLSSSSGALAQRIGPRWPMTVGPLVAGSGLLLLSRVDAGSGYLTGVLPGVLLFGLGMALVATPLTATVLSAAPDHLVGVASGVNNAAARAAQLLAVAALPVAVGLSGADYADPDALTSGYALGMTLCAAVLASGGVIALLTIRSDVLRAG
ncbi:DHA2 family efflux MFS transporter permease subunit [Modestobacter sp. I12A-02628]|uniref:MFS transporter n=2 Tax=Goekera deserti TaxID=2497753 RepID=A0A7K3WDI9_9ACTN|nr:DHA2 family efflux MFS transporter permease subunit [Goekera deserti]NDI48240.1 DHA2 family efflux MFS transporter permease subunit [Goekera deserti]NEL53989.1 MFS transporter [Goekera deserti]